MDYHHHDLFHSPVFYMDETTLRESKFNVHMGLTLSHRSQSKSCGRFKDTISVVCPLVVQDETTFLDVISCWLSLNFIFLECLSIVGYLEDATLLSHSLTSASVTLLFTPLVLQHELVCNILFSLMGHEFGLLMALAHILFCLSLYVQFFPCLSLLDTKEDSGPCVS